MEVNEIKKLLYKVKPRADLIYATEAGRQYIARWFELVNSNTTEIKEHSVQFFVPKLELDLAKEINGISPFEDHVPAQLLIRYIVQ